MRRFSSYGPVDKDLHYYVPRQELVDRACLQLVGENPAKGGHYITIWAPRQRGKTWVMREVLCRLQWDERFDVAKINLQTLKGVENLGEILQYITAHLAKHLSRTLPAPDDLRQFEHVLTNKLLDKPLILILNEFDALAETAISSIANVFRNIYIQRQEQAGAEKDDLLHGVALIGVRSVLGVENVTGSPFNVQRSVHIPNLTEVEVNEMYHWYERESGQPVEQAVIDRVFYETQGQPGLVSWLGELLTETFNEKSDQPITPAQFEEVYSTAINVLPNNNILNIISKARQEPYQDLVLELFRTGEKIPFTYDDGYLNFLYLNGVIDWERASATERYKVPLSLCAKAAVQLFCPHAVS